MKAISIAMTVTLGIASSAIAAEKTFNDYWNEATHAPGAITKQYPRATAITDQKNLTVYIFTKPGDPAHPGVIVRKVVNENGHGDIVTDGHSYGPDSAQPAFKAWMDNPFASSSAH
jgi:hypothetical protein